MSDGVVVRWWVGSGGTRSSWPCRRAIAPRPSSSASSSWTPLQERPVIGRPPPQKRAGPATRSTRPSPRRVHACRRLPVRIHPAGAAARGAANREARNVGAHGSTASSGGSARATTTTPISPSEQFARRPPKTCQAAPRSVASSCCTRSTLPRAMVAVVWRIDRTHAQKGGGRAKGGGRKS